MQSLPSPRTVAVRSKPRRTFGPLATGGHFSPGYPQETNALTMRAPSSIKGGRMQRTVIRISIRRQRGKIMGQVWNGSQWVNRLGATEPRPETEPETPPETGDGNLPDDEAPPNGEENDAET